MTNSLNEKNLRAPLPTGKPEFSDGTNWYSLATENWVLNTVAMIEPCLVATTANLAATYSNGTNGVGATLTNSGANAVLTIDGVALAVNNRVLVKNQTDASQNGIYEVTTVGDTTTPWVLTRSTDFDAASEMVLGTTVNVISGTANSVSAWMLTSNVTTVGTNPITFTEFTGGSAIAPINPCLVATTATLAANYSNGTNGVGATLTNSGANAALTIDGVTLAAGNRVLVKNQTTIPTTSQNGIYEVTTVGDTTTPWVLTRSTDFDAASEMVQGTSVNVISGTTNSVSAWMLTSNVTTVGTDPITFAEFTGNSIIITAPINPCLAATTATLVATYSNGTNGVGATLTNSGTNAALTIDGVALAVNNRVLVKNQTDAFRNGIYEVTTVGDTTTPWVLTRSTDFDAASEMVQGTSVNVISGTANSVSAWMLTSNVTTVGTDSITFTEFTGGGIYQGVASQVSINNSGSGNTFNVGIAENPIIPGTASITIPAGATTARPAIPASGMIRYNTSLS